MRNLLVLLTTLALLSFASACKRDSGPPPPLAADKIGPEFKKGFADATELTRSAAAEVVSALEAKNYVAAFGAAQALCARTDMTKAQQELASRALLTVNGLLKTAIESGDKDAAAALQMHKSSR